MKTVCLDTSHRTLTIALIDQDTLVYRFQKDAFKAQSETIMVELDQAFKRVGWAPRQLEAMVITDGPGSYTGIRIAMTIAKVICQQASLPLYCVSSLQLLAGIHGKSASVMDARSHRVYFGLYENGNPVIEDTILAVDDVMNFIDEKTIIYGDGVLIHKETSLPDLGQRFLDLKPYWKLVENIHTLQPRYLKESEVYLKP